MREPCWKIRFRFKTDYYTLHYDFSREAAMCFHTKCLKGKQKKNKSFTNHKGVWEKKQNTSANPEHFTGTAHFFNRPLHLTSPLRLCVPLWSAWRVPSPVREVCSAPAANSFFLPLTCRSWPTFSKQQIPGLRQKRTTGEQQSGSDQRSCKINEPPRLLIVSLLQKLTHGMGGKHNHSPVHSQIIC